MTSLLSGVSGGGWTLLAGWIFPSGIAFSVFSLLVFRHVDPVAHLLAKTSGAERAAALAVAALALGILLNALQTPLYRALEGYTWPKWVRDRGIGRHLRKKRRLERQIEDLDKQIKQSEKEIEPADQAREEDSKESGSKVESAWLERAVLIEKLARYPVDDRQTTPTALETPSVRSRRTHMTVSVSILRPFGESCPRTWRTRFKPNSNAHARLSTSVSARCTCQRFLAV